MRKKIVYQTTIFLGLVLITAFTIIGYQYKEFYSWFLNDRNNSMFSYSVIATQFFLLVVLSFRAKNFKESRDYNRDRCDLIENKMYEKTDLIKKLINKINRKPIKKPRNAK